MFFKSKQELLERTQKQLMDYFLQLKGPYLCTQQGKYITAEEAANPEYIPWVRFEDRKPPEAQIFLYRPDTDDLYLFDQGTIYQNENFPNCTIVKIEERTDYHEEILDYIRCRKISVWSSDFVNFAMPLIQRVFPQT